MREAAERRPVDVVNGFADARRAVRAPVEAAAGAFVLPAFSSAATDGSPR